MLRADSSARNLGYRRAVRSSIAWRGSRCDKGSSMSPRRTRLLNAKGLVLDPMKNPSNDRVPQWTFRAVSSFLRNGFETITDPPRSQATMTTYRHLRLRHPARPGADPLSPGTRPFLLTIRILPRTRTWSSTLANPQHLMHPPLTGRFLLVWRNIINSMLLTITRIRARLHLQHPHQHLFHRLRQSKYSHSSSSLHACTKHISCSLTCSFSSTPSS
jgi:hypothetical protein